MITLIRKDEPVYKTFTACMILLAVALPAPSSPPVEKIEGEGGLVVHLGCGDGKLTCILGESESVLVQGLDADEADIAVARRSINEKGGSSSVWVKHWPHAHLPYADGVVNLLVVSENSTGIPKEELMRVMAPLGRIYLQSGDRWEQTVKPWPEEMDEWTHYLHNSGGNAVSQDTIVSHPGRLRWTAGPKHCRSHEVDVGIVANVSAKGRFFSVIDQDPQGLNDPRLSESWSLIARDAFSGVKLWERKMKDWGWPQWKPNMRWEKLYAQRRLIPISLPRRLVAAGDRVYATVEYDGGIEVLDAATGKTVKKLDETKGADEIIFLNGKLFVTTRKGIFEVGEKRSLDATIMAVNPGTGAVDWRAETQVVPLTMMACGSNLFYLDGANLICLDVADGRTLWKTPKQILSSKTTRKGTQIRLPLWNVSVTIIAHKDVVLVSGKEVSKPSPQKTENSSGRVREDVVPSVDPIPPTRTSSTTWYGPPPRGQREGAR